MTETRHYRRNSTVGPIEAKVLNEFDHPVTGVTFVVLDAGEQAVLLPKSEFLFNWSPVEPPPVEPPPAAPPSVWVRWHTQLDPPPFYTDGWYADSTRYDLHVPGAALIPPEVVEAALESVDCNRHYIALACLAPILRAARGGAS